MAGIGEWLYVRMPNTAVQGCVRLSRLLLVLVAIELLTMPITQHIWTWDGFLHGGQDFELGLFTIVVCLCLVLLRVQHGRQRLRLFLAVSRFLRGVLRWRDSARMIEAGSVEVRPDPHPSRFATGFTVPLQI